MNKQEALEAFVFYAVNGCILSSRAYAKTEPFHKGDKKNFRELCEAIAQRGFDIVDDCVEDLYDIICNINNQGEFLDADDRKLLIARVLEIIEKEVVPSNGILMQHGYAFGILHSHRRA